MDLYKAIQDLYEEKAKLERVIESLEELQRTAGVTDDLPASTRRRGRKSMGYSERQEVSQRMKKYWAMRRQKVAEKNGVTNGAPEPHFSPGRAS